MVEAGPDVPHALVAIVEELRPHRQFRQGELLLGLLGAQDAGARHTFIFETDQPAMLRV